MNEYLETEVVDATIDDVLGISEVQKETWLATYPNKESGITEEDILSENFFSKDRIESRLKIISDPESKLRFWVAKCKGKVIGYCCAKRSKDANKIRSIYVLPSFQGRGIGQALVDKAFEFLDKSRPVTLTVAIYNTNAISFYEKLGFVKGARLLKNPEGVFISGREIPEMEMIRNSK